MGIVESWIDELIVKFRPRLTFRAHLEYTPSEMEANAIQKAEAWQGIVELKELEIDRLKNTIHGLHLLIEKMKRLLEDGR